ncbi:MAG: hypothetical protein ED557_12020 [Balneola sp.]|nr:MAG: hypothetical protein ED557_12020 [Balneola sp.]
MKEVLKHDVPIIRMLEAYEGVGKDLVYKEELKDIKEDELVDLFGYQENDPLFYDLYEVNSSNYVFFQKKVTRKIELDKYLYVIACYQAPNLGQACA